MATFRVDFRSAPNVATDEMLRRVRSAVEGLANATVQAVEDDAIWIVFNIEGNSLGDAVFRGERELSGRLREAAIEFPLWRAGSAGWMD